MAWPSITPYQIALPVPRNHQRFNRYLDWETDQFCCPPPFVGSAYKRSSKADGLCGIKVEVVASNHADFIRLQL